MPTNARIMVQWDCPLTETELVPLREALCRELELDLEEHFYCDGPLLTVPDPNTDYDYALSNGQQITVLESSYWLDVNIHRSYYGPGYERGDFPCL